MDRAIFDLNASVGATSLYILICALLDQGEQGITLDRVSLQWNGSREELHVAAEELVRRGVLSGGDGHFHVNSKGKWH
jgi:hypothetical protein